MYGDSQSDTPISAHYACYMNIEHFLCLVTANQKWFRQEGAESGEAGEGEAATGEDV